MTSLGELLDKIRWNDDGLAPAIVQDAVSKEVLMLAYMNEEALKRSVESGQTWFWSRSRAEYWHKGATSGHTQRIREIRYDCDADTLLVLVEPQGPACHTGQYSCFFNRFAITKEHSGMAADGKVVDGEVEDPVRSGDRFQMLSVLESVIAAREAERPEGAYTTYLFDQGLDKILKKVGEEAAEVIIAAKNRDPDELRYEVSDLIFHLLVLLREQGLALDEVMKELKKRHGGQ